jgi:hypothetical protein
MLVTSVLAARNFRSPNRTDAIRRIDARLTGAPLATLEDDIAIGQGDAAAEAVWSAHLERMARAAEAARAPKPDFRLSRQDPYALRLLAIVALVAALLFARGPLLETATPVGEAQATVNAGPNFEGWAAPPSYTGLPTRQERLEFPLVQRSR